MLAGLRSRWYDLLNGLWLVPGLVAGAFAVLAFVFLQVDRSFGDLTEGFFGGSASAARTVLSTVAGSVITVAGLAFSITIITLQLVSQQFSPRATRTFLANRPTQVSAGVFLGIFLYCLIVLRTVRDEDFGEFVPGLSVAGGIALGVAGIAVLLFFIHHVAQTIKVSNIAARIARDTLGAIDDLYPEPYGEPVGDPEDGERALRRWREQGEPRSFGPDRPGYVQRVDLDTLVQGLPDGARGMSIDVAPGDFVTQEQALACVWPRGAADGKKLAAGVRRAIVVSSEREVQEDVAYGLQQLADIALRAISPSVNDPNTAATCAGYIGACLERLAGRGFPSTRRRYPERDVEVVVRRPGFGDFVAQGLDEVGRWASSSPVVVVALLSAASRAAAAAADCGAADRVDTLHEAARRIAAPALEDARTDAERAAIEDALEGLLGPAVGQVAAR